MSRLDRTRIVGPLAGYIWDVKRLLLIRGYTRFSTSNRLGWTAQLSRWMLKSRVSTKNLSEERLAKFVRSRRRVDPNFSRGSIGSIIQCLVELGAISQPKSFPKVPPNQIDQVLKKFEKYLREERILKNGPSPYMKVIKRFLLHRFGTQKPRIKAITANDLTQFVLSESRRYSTMSAKNSVSALRSYFNFLYTSRSIPEDLSGAIPAIAGWRMKGIPKGIAPQELSRLLHTPNRRTHSGRRDFAILILLARLGLRRKEVASIELSDIDWKKGEIKIRGKGEKTERLPLPPDIGEALAAHLKKRPQRHLNSRFIFLSFRTPFSPLKPSAITTVVSQTAIKAGLPPMGAHCLRHTLATETLRQGGSLDEIAQVLRHSSHDTTAIYAKVDLLALNTVTQAWPEVLS
jgi:integrase/recombinase XerD